jgi:NAD(P)-dependent dehydrogenase (short-subunit alcohol dehydrogenase family)
MGSQGCKFTSISEIQARQLTLRLQIRVNCISPGHIRTRMTSVYLDANPELLKKWSTSNPLGRLGRSTELRGAAVWLASPASSFCNGSNVIISGGHDIW